LEDEWSEVIAGRFSFVFPERQNRSGKFYDVDCRGGEGDEKFVKARMWRIRALSILAKIVVLGQ
jgi:hypothetical protein